MATLGIITGLAREAACLNVFPRKTRPRVKISGTTPGRAEEAARQSLKEGCDALLSFGVCGGLDPALKPGAIIVADRIIAEDGAKYPTDAAWSNTFAASIRSRCELVTGTVIGINSVVATAGDKRKLFADSGAIAVDMESHQIGAVAEEFEVPFLAVRAVADPAQRGVPSAALYAVRRDGTTRLHGLLLGLLIRPWQAPAIYSLAWDSFAAQSALRRVAALSDPGFALR